MLIRAVKYVYESRAMGDGDIFMDVPAHENFEHLVNMARDREEWKVRVSMVRSPPYQRLQSMVSLYGCMKGMDIRIVDIIQAGDF